MHGSPNSHFTKLMFRLTHAFHKIHISLSSCLITFRFHKGHVPLSSCFAMLMIRQIRVSPILCFMIWPRLRTEAESRVGQLLANQKILWAMREQWMLEHDARTQGTHFSLLLHCRSRFLPHQAGPRNSIFLEPRVILRLTATHKATSEDNRWRFEKLPLYARRETNV